MTPDFRNDAPNALTAALVRDRTDSLVRESENRNIGHGPCRERAIAEVLAGLLSVEIDLETGR